jgi:putative two-component system response regulator
MPMESANILVVDDEPSNVRLLQQMLDHQGCQNVIGTTDSRETLPLFHSFEPDIILLDLMMPEMDGFDVMGQLAPLIPDGEFLPILVLTADMSPATKHRALAAGASDFLTKPFDTTELRLRINALIRTRFLHRQLQQQNVTLEEKVEERTRDLQQAQVEILDRLGRAAEWRDDDTGEHTSRVGLTASLLAEDLDLETGQIDLIRRAAPLHDVGKIGIPDSILLKPGKLTEEEFHTMKTHTLIGSAMLASGHSDLVRMAERIALTHHERWDGTGYPHQLVGDAIPIEGRIVAIADVFDALTHRRPYKKAWSVEEAVEEIISQSGRQFDPTIINAFKELPHDSLV